MLVLAYSIIASIAFTILFTSHVLILNQYPLPSMTIDSSLTVFLHDTSSAVCTLWLDTANLDP